jgi:hypothetical protein
LSNPEEWTQDTIGKLFGGGQQEPTGDDEDESNPTHADLSGASLIRALHPPSEPEPEPEPENPVDAPAQELLAAYQRHAAEQSKAPLTQEERLLKQQREAEESENIVAAALLANDLKGVRQGQAIFGGRTGVAPAPPIEISNVSHARQGPEPSSEPPPPEFDPFVYSKLGRKPSQ